jgi:hypothetical protein
MADEILTMEIQSEPTIEIDLDENRIDPYLQLEDIEVIEAPRTVDTEMSDTSENPVQNKVIKSYVDTRLDKNYVHTQITASNNWTITHNLNKYPAITIVDSGGTVVIGEIEYINLNLVCVKFNGIFSGKAYCN